MCDTLSGGITDNVNFIPGVVSLVYGIFILKTKRKNENGY